jgi:hypothetical protein
MRDMASSSEARARRMGTTWRAPVRKRRKGRGESAAHLDLDELHGADCAQQQNNKAQHVSSFFPFLCQQARVAHKTRLAIERGFNIKTGTRP